MELVIVVKKSFMVCARLGNGKNINTPSRIKAFALSTHAANNKLERFCQISTKTK